jgi:aminoglycoside 6'-N-acetyltransferase
MQEIQFIPLHPSHFSIVHQWFNKPHVQAFYSLRSWTIEEVYKKLMPYVQNEKQIKSFIIYNKQFPIGYIQSYPVKDHPWENQDLPDSIIQKAAGLDLFIGEESCLGKGLGCIIINRLIEEQIWPSYQYCLADPDIRNRSSIRLFHQCRFVEHKQIIAKDALNRPVSLQLFIKENRKQAGCESPSLTY